VASLLPDAYLKKREQVIQLTDQMTGYKATLGSLLRFHPHVYVVQEHGSLVYKYCGPTRVPVSSRRNSGGDSPDGSTSAIPGSPPSTSGRLSPAAEEPAGTGHRPGSSGGTGAPGLMDVGPAGAGTGAGAGGGCGCPAPVHTPTACEPEVASSPSADPSAGTGSAAAPSATPCDVDFGDGILGEQQRLLRLLAEAGSGGLLASTIPSEFSRRYGRPMHPVDHQGLTVPMRDLIWCVG
jgi:hypothetical protein